MTAPQPGEGAAAHVEALRTSLAALIAESQTLRQDVHVAESARRRNALINLGVLGLLILFVVLNFVTTWQNNAIARQVRDGNARIVDCTTAGGTCYEDGKSRTGQAISAILHADIYVAECARQRPGDSGPVFDAFIEKCVAGRLAAAQTAAPPASPAPSPTPS